MSRRKQDIRYRLIYKKRSQDARICIIFGRLVARETMFFMIEGFIFYTLGGASLLLSLALFFPQIAFKDAKNHSPEQRKSMRKTAIGAAVVGVVFIILGIIFKF